MGDQRGLWEMLNAELCEQRGEGRKHSKALRLDWGMRVPLWLSQKNGRHTKLPVPERSYKQPNFLQPITEGQNSHCPSKWIEHIHLTPPRSSGPHERLRDRWRGKTQCRASPGHGQQQTPRKECYCLLGQQSQFQLDGSAMASIQLMQSSELVTKPKEPRLRLIH